MISATYIIYNSRSLHNAAELVHFVCVCACIMVSVHTRIHNLLISVTLTPEGCKASLEMVPSSHQALGSSTPSPGPAAIPVKKLLGRPIPTIIQDKYRSTENYKLQQRILERILRILKHLRLRSFWKALANIFVHYI